MESRRHFIAAVGGARLLFAAATAQHVATPCKWLRRTKRVHGQNEAYDIARDSWEQYAQMPTPRHGLGAAAIGNTIYVADGGAVMGCGIQSAVHEAFTVE